MERTEHSKIIKELLGMTNPDKQADASALLTKLSEDYEETLTNLETASKNVTDLTTKNETLRDVNAKLFLKVGTTDKENKDENKDDAGTNQEENKLTFDALFNEKGELI